MCTKEAQAKLAHRNGDAYEALNPNYVNEPGIVTYRIKHMIRSKSTGIKWNVTSDIEMSTKGAPYTDNCEALAVRLVTGETLSYVREDANSEQKDTDIVRLCTY